MTYQFDRFELDPASYRLAKDGESVRLEPRVLELLVYLIERSERVVGKDEIFEVVWGGQAVSDSVLTRAIYEIRRALDDNTKDPAFVATVHGRGYRFIAPVGEIAASVKNGPEPLASDSDQTASPVSGPASGQIRDISRHRIGRAAVLGIAAALGLAALVAWGTQRWDRVASHPAGASPAGSELGLVADAATPRLALVPFTVRGSDPELELMSLSMTDLIWARLSSQPGLVVRTPDYSGGLELTASSIERFMQETGTDTVLSGHLEPIAGIDRAELVVELHQMDDDSRISSFLLSRYDMPPISDDHNLSSFTRVREAITRQVVTHLGGVLAIPATGSSSPRNPEAFKLYLTARKRLLDLTCGESAWVIDLLDRSLELDPDFAHAWIAQGYAHYSQVWSCGREAAYAENTLAATQRALELEPNNPQGLFLRTLVLTDSNRAAEAWDLLEERQLETEPSPILIGRSYVLRVTGHLAESEAMLRQALELDPMALLEVGEAPVPLLYTGEIEDFLRLLPADNSPYNLFYRGLAELLAGRPEEARKALEPAFRNNPNDLFARYAAALLAVLDSDRVAAGEIVRQIVRQRRIFNSLDGEMTFKEAQLMALAGDESGALEQITLAVQQGFFCPSCIADDPLLAELADEPEFRSAVAHAEQRQREFRRDTGYSG